MEVLPVAALSKAFILLPGFAIGPTVHTCLYQEHNDVSTHAPVRWAHAVKDGMWGIDCNFWFCLSY